MSDDFNRTGDDGPSGDPALYRGFVEFRLKKGMDRNEVVRLLIQRGLTQGQAATLVDSILTNMVEGPRRSGVGALMLARVTVAGIIAVAVVLFAWARFIPEDYYYAGYPLMGVAVGMAVALAGWTRRSNMFLVIAGVLAILGCYLGVNADCSPYNHDIIRALTHIIPTDYSVRGCFKNRLIHHHQIYWAGGGIVLALLIAGQRRLRVRWL